MKSIYLDQILNRINTLPSSEAGTGIISRDWVFVTMALFRQHLDETKQSGHYKILMFYCNWLLHTTLENGGSSVVPEMIVKMSNVINDPGTGHPADRISEIISLTHLRSEIIQLLKKDAQVNCGIFDLHPNWVSFSEMIFPFILNKPLVKKISVDTGTEYWVEKLELYDDSGKLGWKIIVNPGNQVFQHYIYRTDLLDK